MSACQALGFPLHRDVNDGPIEGVSPIQMNVRRGRRVSTARAYLRQARRRPNLRVLTGVRQLYTPPELELSLSQQAELTRRQEVGSTPIITSRQAKSLELRLSV